MGQVHLGHDALGVLVPHLVVLPVHRVGQIGGGGGGVPGAHRVGLLHAGSQGGGGRGVDIGGGQQAVLVHLQPHAGDGHGQHDLIFVRHAGVRVGDGRQGLIHLVQGRGGVAGLAGAHPALGQVGVLVVVGHEDHLVAGLPQGVVIVPAVPLVGLDAHPQVLALGQRGPEGGHELGEGGAQGGAQALKVDGQTGVVPGGLHQLLHRGLAVGGAEDAGQVVPGGVHVQVVGHPRPLQGVGGQLGALGHRPLVAACAGLVQIGLAAAVQGHAGPAQADAVHLLGHADLAVGAHGVKAVEKADVRVVLVVHPHQHGRRLLAGGGVAGQEEQAAVGLLDAVDDAELIGQGDVPPVLRHVGEGQLRRRLGQGQTLVPQGAHQHDGHVLAADVVVGPEVQPRVDGPVGQGGLHGGVVPGAGHAVGEGGLLRLHHLPAEHAAQHHHKGGPVHVLAVAEGAVPLALNEAVVRGFLDNLLGPVPRGHVGIAPGRRGRHGRQSQQQTHRQKGGCNTMLHSRNTSVSGGFSPRPPQNRRPVLVSIIA